MYYYYSYLNVAIPMLNGNANKDCCCCCCVLLDLTLKLTDFKRNSSGRIRRNTKIYMNIHPTVKAQVTALRIITIVLKRPVQWHSDLL